MSNTRALVKKLREITLNKKSDVIITLVKEL